MIIYQPVYTLQEAAETLRITEDTLMTMIARGVLAGVLIENTVLIRGIDLEDFINSLTQIYCFQQWV